MKQKYIDKFIQKVLDEDPYDVKTYSDRSKKIIYKVGWFKKIYISIVPYLGGYYVSHYGIFGSLSQTKIVEFANILPIDDIHNSFREHILRAAT